MTLQKVLWPLARLYQGAATLRGWAYRTGRLRVHPAGVPVISVGGLAMGGSGKTPVTALLAGRLLASGLPVGVVCGGYGGSAAHRIGQVEPGCRTDPRAVRRFGDEAVLLASWLEGATVHCGRDKLAAARSAVSAGARIVLVDDGFQHRRLWRDLDIVVLGEKDCDLALPPVGVAREPAAALRRADLVWRHGRDGRPPCVDNGQVASVNVARAVVSLDGTRVAGVDSLHRRRVFLLSGIARPAAFRALVEQAGAVVVGHLRVRDHHLFSPRHLRRAARARPDLLLCTEKDAVRMVGRGVACDLFALTCSVEIRTGGSVLDRLLQDLVSCC